MSTIGSGVGGVGTPAASGATATAAGGGGAAALALRDPRLAAHAQALAGVAAGTATLGFGASGAHVRAIQEALAAAGFAAPASGTLDRATQQQVALFQRSKGLAPSGEIDRATLEALDAAGAGARPGSGAGRPVIGGAGTATSTSTSTSTRTTGAGGATAATTAATDPLAGKPFIDAATFASMPPYQWARDSVELESVMGVRMDPARLLDLLRETDGRGRTLYQRLRRPEMANAFTLGYGDGGIDDLRWDSQSHELRERSKLVWLTVEGGRYEPDPETGEREVSVGTDKMDDTYYDTAKFDLLEDGFSVRGRARWDTDTEIRRLLVGVKANTVVDELGIKRNDKTDIRNDGASPEDIANLDRDVRSGKVSWRRGSEPIKPMKGVYDALRAKGVLPDVGPHEDVLLLEPKVHIRSVRSRYHLNETDLSDVRKLHADGGAPKVRFALDLAAKARAAGGLAPDELARLQALERAGRELLALASMPDRGFRAAPASFEELERERALAEETDAKYHAFAAELDGARRILANAREQTYEGHARLFAAWQRSADRSLANKGAYDPFLAKYDAMTDRDREAFNRYGEERRAAGARAFRDFTPLGAGGWRELRPALLNETIRVHQRMIEAAGSAARGLWFDSAREFYVPDSSRATSNFLIDTFDMSEYVKHEDWESIPAAERTPAQPLPRDKVFHATLVAESQIELGLEKPYLDRIDALRAQIEADRASLVMKWMTAGGYPGIDPANAATYGIALAALAALPDAQLEGEVAKLNDFLRAQGSALRPLAAGDLRGLDAKLLTLEGRDRPVRTDGAVERDLDGALFVFRSYLDAQKLVSEAKGDRVVRTLRDAGAPRGLRWETPEASKGEGALKMLAGVR